MSKDLKISKTKKDSNNISSIPLKVKPVKSPPKIKKQNIKVSSTIKAILVTIILIINFTLIIHISHEIDESNKRLPTVTSVIKEKIPASTNVLGSWQTSLEGLFSFQDDYTFYWYDSYKYPNDNYYGGTYTYKQGLEALEEMGYNEEEFNTTFKEGYSVDKVYSLKLKPTVFVQGGQDLSSKSIKENELWWYILIIRNDNTAIAYNQTLDLRYSLKRK